MRIHSVVRLLLLLLLSLPLMGFASGAQGQAEGSPVVVTLRFEGALHPAMDEYIKRALQTAEREDADLIILELDTPGGSTDLMMQLVQRIRASEIPIVVYVTPRGAMAGSAGTLITLAGHAAAMAPETTIGAASPVGGSGEDIGETMESKLKEMFRANVRTLAVGRPEEAIALAEDMIENARAVSVDEALEIGLVDIKASNQADLLAQLDGRSVRVVDETIVLETAGAQIIAVQTTFLEDVLMVLANPNIAFLLLAIGTQAVLIEISSPGGWVAGFIGAVCLLLAVYGMGLLPVNWFGILFLVLAFVLFILEINAPTHGALTAAGVGSFIVGALVLFNSPAVPAFQRVSVPLVVGTGSGLGLIFFAILGYALRAQRAPVRIGRESLVGMIGAVNTPLNPTGTVQMGSELWTATLVDGGQAARGEQVQVIAVDHLLLKVRKVE